jgi:pantoate--beta-alanine ligase
MQVIHTVSELRLLIAQYKQAGESIGFVPTMGNLHQGHLQLVSQMRQEASVVVCSIFVNPLQFGEGEDYSRYPKTLEQDVAALQAINCDLVFAPSVEEMYPQSMTGRDQSQVVVPGISEILEGASRPGHFTGVATVVAKLFNMVQPDKAIFGEKDFQQLQVIRQFVRELCFPVKILAHPIVREANGLAMSSRNGYLSADEKQQASLIYQTIKQIAERISLGERNYASLASEAEQALNDQGFVSDYIEIRNPDLSPADNNSQSLVILAAVFLGATRLIDNIQLSLV